MPPMQAASRNIPYKVEIVHFLTDNDSIGEAITKRAEALKAAAYALNPPERTGALLAANEIAHRLKQDNSRFERKRFLEACGLDPS